MTVIASCATRSTGRGLRGRTARERSIRSRQDVAVLTLALRRRRRIVSTAAGSSATGSGRPWGRCGSAARPPTGRARSMSGRRSRSTRAGRSASASSPSPVRRATRPSSPPISAAELSRASTHGSLVGDPAQNTTARRNVTEGDEERPVDARLTAPPAPVVSKRRPRRPPPVPSSTVMFAWWMTFEIPSFGRRDPAEVGVAGERGRHAEAGRSSLRSARDSRRSAAADHLWVRATPPPSPGAPHRCRARRPPGRRGRR